MPQNNPKRIPVKFEPDVDRIINSLVGKLGNNPPEVIRKIVTIYLTERGYFR